MVVQIGKVVGSALGTNRDSDETVMLLQVEVSDADDVQTVELHRGAGVDFNPPEGSIVALVNGGNAWQIAATTNDNVGPDGLDEGAYEIYSSASGAKAAKVNLDPGGDVTINDGTKSAVSFPQLKAQFDQLTSDFNSLVNLYNAHVHPGVTTGPGSTAVTVSLGSVSTASVDAAESDTIKVP